MVKVTSYFYDEPDSDTIWMFAENNNRGCYVNLPSDVIPFERPLSDTDIPALVRELEEKGFDPAKLPHIEDADPVIIDLYHGIMDSDNNMWFVESDETPWDEFGIDQQEYERRVDMEIKKYGLENVITKQEDEALYTCYGNLQSAFSVPCPEKTPIMGRVAPVVGAMIYHPFLAEVKDVGSRAVAMLKDDGLYLYQPVVHSWIKNNTWLAMLLEGKVFKA